MKKISLILLLTFSINSWAQKLRLSDLQKISSLNTDQAAEFLYVKGFILRHASIGRPFDYKSFLYENGKENIDVNFEDYYDDLAGTREIRGCFSLKLDNEFKILESQIKSTLKKNRFFFSSEYNNYFTEYVFGDKYLYLNRGICFDEKTKLKLGSFIIVDERMK